MPIPLHTAYDSYREKRGTLLNLLNRLANECEQHGIRVVSDSIITHLQPIYRSDIPSVSVTQIIDEARAKASSPFRIGTIGDFSRGKTTLINAMLEREVLTSDYRPNTATRTVIRYADSEFFRVTYFAERNQEPLVRQGIDVQAELRQFTSDSAVDPEEYTRRLFAKQESLAEQIEEVEVFLRSNFLCDRDYEFYDTPGLGSPFEQHQIITYNTLPPLNLILFVVQADPGISGGELAFLSSFKDHLDRVVFALTKIDKLASQADIKSMIEFTRDAIRINLGIESPEIFPVNALAALEQKQLEASGLQSLVQGIDVFLSQTIAHKRLSELGQLALTLCLWLRHDIQVQQTEIEVNKAFLGLRLTSMKDAFTTHTQQLESLATFFINTEVLASALAWSATTFRSHVQNSVEEKLRLMSGDQIKHASLHLHTLVTEINDSYMEGLDDIFSGELALIGNYMKAMLIPIDPVELTSASFSKSKSQVPEFSLLVEQASIVVQLMSQVGVSKFLRSFFIKQLSEKDIGGRNVYDRLVLGKSGIIELWNDRYDSWNQKVMQVYHDKILAYIAAETTRQENAQQDILGSIATQTQQIQSLQEKLSWIFQVQAQVTGILQ